MKTNCNWNRVTTALRHVQTALEESKIYGSDLACCQKARNFALDEAINIIKGQLQCYQEMSKSYDILDKRVDIFEHK